MCTSSIPPALTSGPPGCRNSLHSHRTAEVFFALSGRWRFFWGRWGTAGEVVLEEGDIINIPTGIFRAFENIGTGYGMIMAVLGGDDAGGGVVWAPQVITDAKDYGLVLGRNGKLYDSKKGQSLPAGVDPMPQLTDAELTAFPEPTTADVVPHHVARYWDLMALSDRQPARVFGPNAKLRDKPGFDVELLSRQSIPATPYAIDTHEVLMPMRGHWRLTWTDSDRSTGTSALNPGDTVGRDCDASDTALMPAQRFAHWRAGGGIPEAQFAVLAAADDTAAVGREGDASDIARMPAHRFAQRRTGGGIPQTQRSVDAAADDAGAVGGEGNTVGVVLMPAQGLAQRRAGAGIPEAQCAVFAAADHAAAIGGEGDAPNAALVPAQGVAQRRTGSGIPETQRAVVAAADDAAAVGREGYTISNRHRSPGGRGCSLC